MKRIDWVAVAAVLSFSIGGELLLAAHLLIAHLMLRS